MKKTLSLVMMVLLFSGSTAFAKWPTYNNKEYGFKISYPPKAALKPSFDSYYLIGKSWRYGAGPVTGKPVVSIDITPKTAADSAGVFVRIGVSKDKDEVANCIQGSTDSRIINGVTFAVFPFSDAAMSKTLQGVSYRVIHQKHCISIEKVMTYSLLSIAKLDQRQRALDQLNQAYDELDYIISTFGFEDPSKMCVISV